MTTRGGVLEGAPGRPGTVKVGPFEVDDLSCDELAHHVVDAWHSRDRDRAVLVYALHVGGLNHRASQEFVASMRAADVVYADGGSVVWLARLSGASSVERAPTTDVGWGILSAVSAYHGRPARVALVGGHPGLAERAADVLRDGGTNEPVLVEHGYHEDWSGVLERLRSSSPDVCVVGLGAPREMLWTDEHREELPPSIVLTCGGWFGHLVGDEQRAPRILRRSGLEWIARVAQAPRRLGPRYVVGIRSTAELALPALWRRTFPS